MSIALLLLVSLIYFVSFIGQLVSDPNHLLPLMLGGLGLGLIWLLAAGLLRRR